ncbi:MAG: MFS transporter [Candidatus Omnitrophota bacterium]|nr:MFS transporter [Candidatus Omnitrophota bacterium]
MLHNYIKILGKKNFFLLWFSQIISQFGDKLTQVALIGLVSQISQSSASLAVTISMTIVPVLIFSPISGVYVDRWSKRKTMYICDLLRGLLILCIIYLLNFKSLPFIYVIIFLSFSVGRFFIPAKMAFIPKLVLRKDIFLANSLISVTATIAAVIGIGLGGIIVDKYGISTTFIIDSFTFFISALAISLITLKEKGEFLPKDIFEIGKDAASVVKKSFVRELKEGIQYIYRSDETKYAFTIFLFLFSCVGGLFPVFTKFIQTTLGSVTKDLGFVGVSLGLGIFMGSLIYGKIADKFPVKTAINFSIMFGALYNIVFTVSLKHHPSSLLAIILAFVMGIIISPIFVGVNALIHRESKDELLGRIFGGLEFVSHFGFLISMFIFAYLADIFSPFTIMVSIGIISFLFSIIFISYDSRRRT